MKVNRHTIFIWFDPHFFAAKKCHMFLNLNCLFIDSHFLRNELASWRLKQNFLVAKVDILVALATKLVAVFSPGIVMTWAFRKTDIHFWLTFVQVLCSMCSLKIRIILKYLMDGNAAVHFVLFIILVSSMVWLVTIKQWL